MDQPDYVKLTKLLPRCKLKAALYIVATPLGHPGDITLRALLVLQSADCIAAEDTRVSGKLLARYGITADLIAYHDHNEEKMAETLAQRVASGQSVALISDAGTPLISDPGYRLLQACLRRGVAVEILPGASAVIASVAAAGLPPVPFQFCGFLPAKGKAGKLEEYANIDSSLVFFEAARRLVETLQSMQEFLGDRDAAIVRELTKTYEDIRRGKLSELIAHYTAHEPLGEVTIVVGPPDAEAQKQQGRAQLDEILLAALKNHSVKEASAQIAKQLGLPKGEVYKRALALRDSDD